MTTRTPARSRRSAQAPAPEPVPVPEAAAADEFGAAEELPLIQLLTPEGERRSHPDYPLDVDAEQARALYRDLVLVRRVDAEGTAQIGRAHV